MPGYFTSHRKFGLVLAVIPPLQRLGAVGDVAVAVVSLLCLHALRLLLANAGPDEPLVQSLHLRLQLRGLARGYCATFTAGVLDSTALDTLSLINTTVFAVAVPALPVPWFVDLTFAAALGSYSNDLVPLFTLLHNLQLRWTTQQLTPASASLPAVANKCHERAACSVS
eukprot:3892382-Pleurochrysis_carterae.AAC.1